MEENSRAPSLHKHVLRQSKTLSAEIATDPGLPLPSPPATKHLPPRPSPFPPPPPKALPGSWHTAPPTPPLATANTALRAQPTHVPNCPSPCVAGAQGSAERPPIHAALSRLTISECSCNVVTKDACEKKWVDIRTSLSGSVMGTAAAATASSLAPLSPLRFCTRGIRS